MISKAETLQRLKKMGMIVADDQSIVTVLLPNEVAFENGLKDVRQKLKELGYDSSFCVKQSKDSLMQTAIDKEKITEADRGKEEVQEEVSAEEISSYMAVDSDGQFSLDDDGQFTLGLEF